MIVLTSYPIGSSSSFGGEINGAAIALAKEPEKTARRGGEGGARLRDQKQRDRLIAKRIVGLAG